MTPLRATATTPVMRDAVFVFGSNLAGRHGRGAARHAVEAHGAVRGKGFGPQGRAYAIPTKDRNVKTLPLVEIGVYAYRFIEHARAHPEIWFLVTRVGCGLAGYSSQQVAPLFRGLPRNCVISPSWSPWFPEHLTHPDSCGCDAP